MAREAFQYATVRVIPSLEREEFLNAGVVVFHRQRKFLAARVGLDVARLRALAPDLDPGPVTEALQALALVAAGDRAGGPAAALDQPDRFHWLVAPSSTTVQPGPVHTGLCDDPEATLERLFSQLVR